MINILRSMVFFGLLGLVCMGISSPLIDSGNKVNYTIIYINGPSSSGKSTLIKALQEAFDIPFLCIGIDKITEMMPQKNNNGEAGVMPIGFSWKLSVGNDGFIEQKQQRGVFAQEISNLYREILKTLIKQNVFFIIEDVACGKQEVDNWRNFLQDSSVLYVGLHAPLDVLEKRERERGDRMIGLARSFYGKVHTGVCYDLYLDTHKNSVEENVAMIESKLYD